MLGGKGTHLIEIRKASSCPESLVSATGGRSSDLLLCSGRLPERLGFQWHSGQREELTAAGTARDLHPIPY